MFTTAHPWRDGHSTSISVCGMWEGQGSGFKSPEGALHTYKLRLG